ncbi:oxidoreductase [Dyella acidiphila]|uniref:SDR family NAD(P)-dependent oxidoreductase n=1 Tax=Dyella acidiphila TaxID=2775866 RepID=A0ABR9GEH3_9GAMM|nr:oxidoreductase [Dyella acidiphila]MBE1162452.1 SDR family NAD(P)-dependent oxidoreductase [Dyella acidiphila]
MSKIWLITGSARGLGRHLAEAVLAAGHRLVATARQPEKLQDLVDRYGDRIRAVALDVTDAKAAQAAVDAAVAAYGRLDVLVNNAGFGYAAPFEQTSDADFRAQIDTNLYGVVNLTRAALPVMRKQRAGHIFQISSVGGRIGTPGMSAYQAAKWAVSGFTEVLAKEAAPFGVKVTSIEPGGMRTDWADIARGAVPDLLPDYEPSVGVISKLLNSYAGHEAGDPDKVAQVLLQLAEHAAPPEHLLLGSDALHFFEQVDNGRRADAERWRAVSLSTDADDAGPRPEISLVRETAL